MAAYASQKAQEWCSASRVLQGRGRGKESMPTCVNVLRCGGCVGMCCRQFASECWVALACQRDAPSEHAVALSALVQALKQKNQAAGEGGGEGVAPHACHLSMHIQQTLSSRAFIDSPSFMRELLGLKGCSNARAQ